MPTPYDPSFEAAFGDGEHRFRLCGLKEWAELEDKTGLVRRFLQMQQHVDRIITAAGDIKTINYRQYENPRLEELAETILDAAAALKE